jgi:putative endonuclease
MYSCYIIYSHSADKFYIGFTENLKERLKKHNASHKGFTGKFHDWKFVYIETFYTKKEATSREKQIKSWKSRQLILKLIQNYNSSAG